MIERGIEKNEQSEMRLRQAVLLVILFVAVLVLVYTRLRSTPVKPTPVLVNSSGYVGVIFPAVSFDRGSWTPRKKDVVDAENRLPSFIKQEALAHPGGTSMNSSADKILKQGLSSYKRQYVGLTERGQKVLFINFFCDPPPTNWQKQMVLAFDGGSCFFNVQFSMQNKTFSQLVINPTP